MKIRRLDANPILRPGMHDAIGRNINGPSLIRVPEWVSAPLGRYYLYFAHHHGAYIRLAFADRLEGPWRVHGPGTLRLEDTPLADHVASPDVHVDHEACSIRMYVHGVLADGAPDPLAEFGARFPVLGRQRTIAAVSDDGLKFRAGTEVIGTSYVRAFRYDGSTYALGMPGIFFRSRGRDRGFEPGPSLFSAAMRHGALRLRGDVLEVYYSNAGDCPERILRARIDLRGDWMTWSTGPAEEIIAPETGWEGGDLPLVASMRGAAHERVRQLRDPCIYEEDGRTWLLYSVAGERGIAIAEIEE